jgi:signal transduction histidine kinase/CheY-like chemotaxis protein
VPSIEKVAILTTKIESNLFQLFRLRDNLDETLGQQIQMLTGRKLREANEHARAGVAQSRMLLLAALCGLLVAVLGGAFYLARGVVRPIQSLATFAEEIGRGNLDASVEVRSVTEIGLLARKLMEMSDGLQNAQHDAAAEEAERLKLQQALNQNERLTALGRLTGGIAHDFNNMLAIMNGYADRAIRNIRDPDIVRESLNEIKTAAENVGETTARLLTFSGQRRSPGPVFEVKSLVEDIQSLVKMTVGKEYNVEFDFRNLDARLKAHSGDLVQAVINLVINASHASKPKSTIRLATYCEELPDGMPDCHPALSPGRYVVISVADQGSGIPASVMPRIFEPFFTTKPQGKGTGLGLAMVLGFARQSGGGIVATSEEGHGTTMRLYVPESKQNVDAAIVDCEEAHRGKGETVLLIDDDPKILELTQETLVHLGYRVHAAPGGVEALEIALDPDMHMDVVLSDVTMPSMTGVEVLEIIREQRPGIPAVLISGFPGRLQDVKIPDDVLFLQKPAKTEELARVLRQALDSQGAYMEMVRTISQALC